MAVEILGIRHHGPASARCVQQALQQWQPDCLLVEGPPEADELLSWIGHRDLQPPVALLVYRQSRPQDAAFYPLVEYSPEWQALLYANQAGIPARFFDLPAHYQLNEPPQSSESPQMRKSANTGTASGPSDGTGASSAEQTEAATTAEQRAAAARLREDPFRLMARAAGYDDPERWWDYLIEHRHSSDGLLQAIHELMAAFRQEVEKDEPADRLTLAREAAMRQNIRRAHQEGFQRIAVVCGAWHAPALTAWHQGADTDQQLLDEFTRPFAALPRDLQATWVPWSYHRLSTASGYRSGIVSPAWYEYLWSHPGPMAVPRWMSRSARLLREGGFDIGPAHAIEATRLAQTLAALRNRIVPDLNDLEEAMQAVYCYRDDRPLQLIRQRLIIGDRLGSTPKELTLTPLHHDVTQTCKQLYLDPRTLFPVRSTAEEVDLDLREPLNQNRSVFYHRLVLLGFDLQPRGREGAVGTFHEIWKVQWGPEDTLNLVEKSVYGTTLAEAATQFVRHRLPRANLETSARLVESLLFADLPGALADTLEHVQELTAQATDVLDLLASWPRFAQQLRYGNVRQSDQNMLRWIVDEMFVRVCLYLPLACQLVKDEVAGHLGELIANVHNSVSILRQEQQEQWWRLLQELAETAGHARLRGQTYRWLYEANKEATPLLRLQRLLSPGTPPEEAIDWLQGFFYGGVSILIHDNHLQMLLDEWLLELPEDTFVGQLPLLRRVFAQAKETERRQLLELLALRKQEQSNGEQPRVVDARRAEWAATWPRLLSQWEQEAAS